MRAPFAALLASTLVAACGGHTASPSNAPAPAARQSAPADPATLRYAAGSGRYRLESAGRYAQEVMGNSQELSLNQAMLFATTLAEEAGNLAFSAMVESLTVTGDAPGVDSDALGAVRGQTFRSVFTPTGRAVSSSVPDTTNAAIQQVGRLFRDFLPKLPPSTTAGTTWVDTVNDTQTMAGGAGQTATQAIREHRVVGWETREGGVRALHLSSNGHYTIAGTGDVQGQPIEISGAGQGAAERWVSAAGVYLGGVTNDSTNLTVNVLNVGITVPVRQVQRIAITRLP